MKAYRVIASLITLTIALQVFILYRQYKYNQPQARNAPERIREAPKDAFVELKNFPIEGSENAGVVLVEFSDYECPFCQRHTSGVGKDLHDKYVSTGLIRHAFVDYPLPMHPHAKQLASAALCAGEQGAYWKMHDLLFEDKPITREAMLSAARRLSLDLDRFEKCFDANSEKTIAQNAKLAEQFGITGTPTFALGRIETGGRVHISKILTGALPFNDFETTITEAMTVGAK